MYFLAAASSASVGPSSAIRLTTSRMTCERLRRAIRARRGADDQARRIFVGHQRRADAVGEAALFAHLVEQARGERAAAQDVVHQVGGEEVRRVARHAGIGELQRGLRQVVVDPDLLAELRDRHWPPAAGSASPAGRRTARRASASAFRRRSRRPPPHCSVVAGEDRLVDRRADRRRVIVASDFSVPSSGRA